MGLLVFNLDLSLLLLLFLCCLALSLTELPPILLSVDDEVEVLRPPKRHHGRVVVAVLPTEDVDAVEVLAEDGAAMTVLVGSRKMSKCIRRGRRPLSVFLFLKMSCIMLWFVWLLVVCCYRPSSVIDRLFATCSREEQKTLSCLGNSANRMKLMCVTNCWHFFLQRIFILPYFRALFP